MKTQDIIISEEKVRLDPACWHNKKIGNPKTKVKGGVRVNNCVPAESVEEAANPAQQAAIAIAKKKKAGVDEAAPPGAKAERMVKHIKKGYAKDGKLSDKEKSIAYATAWKAHNKGVAEDDAGDVEQRMIAKIAKYKEHLAHLKKTDPEAYKREIEKRKTSSRIPPVSTFEGQGVAEAQLTPMWQDDPEHAEYLKRQADISRSTGLAVGDRVTLKNRPGFEGEIVHDWGGGDFTISGGGGGMSQSKNHRANARLIQKIQGVAEEYNPEYDDEAGMADNNLETLERAVRGIDDLIQTGDNLPEWCQEKIAVAKSMLVAVWDYMESEENSEEVDPEIDAMFEAMDQLAEEMAAKKGVSADLVWETFEAMDDHMLYETAAWRRKEGKSAKGGLNAKGVASYRRENPGSKLQTAVTTKPSKLKPGSKAAKRRKSFCARMGGVKGPMKKPNGKPTRKALALRKWNC